MISVLEAFEYITTFSVKENGSIYIDDIEKYLQCCDIVEKALKNEDSSHSIY